MTTMNYRTKSVGCEISHQILWDGLSLAQQFSVSSLMPFGYTLIELQPISTKSVAVLAHKNKIATVCSQGLINFSTK